MAQAIEQTWFVYILSNGPCGTLYVGSTNDLVRRISQHKLGILSGFPRRYGLDRLVWFDPIGDMSTTRRREWLMKRWRRDWKIELIEKANPDWRDLYPDLVG
jgi:putative endonuclease